MDISLWLTFAKERIHLPTKQKGCGLHGAADRRYAKYGSVAVQSIMPLIDRKYDRGCAITGHLNLPVVVNLFWS